MSSNPLPSRLLLVTDRRQAVAPLEAIAVEAIGAGARWIWLRDRDMAPAARRALAARLVALVRRHGGHLSIGGEADLAAEVGADGVQLPAGSSVAAARARLGPGALIGLSAHRDADIAAARAGGADYVTLSPVFATASKPGYGPALGLAAVTRASPLGIPVLALGGVTAARAPACLDAGAAGIAVMGEVMRASDRPGGVAQVVRTLSAALHSEFA